MKKNFILLVGCLIGFTSAFAANLEELNVNIEGKAVNLGMDFEKRHSISTKLTADLPNLSGRKVYIDLMTFDKKGQVTYTGKAKHLETAWSSETADYVVKIRPVAIDYKTGSGHITKIFGSSSSTWELFQQENIADQHKTSSNISSSAALMTNVNAGGVSSGASAGVGLVSAVFSDNSKSIQVIYHIQIQNPDNTKTNILSKTLGVTLAYLDIELADIVEEIVNP